MQFFLILISAIFFPTFWQSGFSGFCLLGCLSGAGRGVGTPSACDGSAFSISKAPSPPIPLEGGDVSMLSKEKKCIQVTSARTWLPFARPVQAGGEGHGCWGCSWEDFISFMRSFHSIVKIQYKAFLKDHVCHYRVISQNYNVVVMYLNSQMVVITVSACLLFFQNILFPNNVFTSAACSFSFPIPLAPSGITAWWSKPWRTPWARTEVLTLLGCLQQCIYFGQLKWFSGKWKLLTNRGVSHC